MSSSLQRSFTIQFEEDIDVLPPFDRTHRGFRSPSPAASTRSDSPARALSNPEYLVTEQEVSQSYLSATLTTIQPLPDNKSLLIMAFTCHPAPGRRFENATIAWHISDSTLGSTVSSPASSIVLEKPLSPPAYVLPKILAFAPQHSVGGWTEEQSRLMWGLSAPIQGGPGFVSAGIEPSIEKETQKQTLHAMTIQGSVRGGGSRAHWTVVENSSSQRGIPSNFQLAIVVSHSGRFQMDLDVKAELAGGIFNSNIVAKKGKANNLSRIIDVDIWKVGEVIWGTDEGGWKRFMAEMTGEVQGTQQEFGQKIVAP